MEYFEYQSHYRLVSIIGFNGLNFVELTLNQMGGLYKQAQWSGLQTIVRVVRTRHLWNKTEKEVMFISVLYRQMLND